MFFLEQHELMRKLAREFAEKELTFEVLDKVEDSGIFPKNILEKMGRVGFFGIKIPQNLGGAGSDTRGYVVIMEEIARVSGIASVYVTLPNSLGAGPLLLSGTQEQLEKYLKPVAKGEKILAFGLTEPGAGSDAACMTTTATQCEDYFILNGRKTFITSAPIADFAIIYAKTDMS